MSSILLSRRNLKSMISALLGAGQAGITRREEAGRIPWDLGDSILPLS